MIIGVLVAVGALLATACVGEPAGGGLAQVTDGQIEPLFPWPITTGCNDGVPQLGDDLVPEELDEPAPAMTGGVVRDGTYVLTRVRTYGVRLESFHAETLRVSEGRYTLNLLDVPRGGELIAAGDQLTFTFECPEFTSVTVGYSASEDQLEILEPQGDGFTLRTYQRQP